MVSSDGHLITSFLACLAVLVLSLGFPRAKDFEPLHFPVRTPGDIARVAAFGVPLGNRSEPHDGTDLVVRGHLRSTMIVSPADGTVREVHVREDAGTNGRDEFLVEVEIFINPDWSVVLKFEPSTADPRVQTAQVDAIRVRKGQRVAAGDDIGNLLVGELGYSNLHYSVLRGGRPVCARTCSSETAKKAFDAIPGPPIPLTRG